MARGVLWLLFCSLLTTARGLDNCLPSREAYVNLSLGTAEEVPINFTSGTYNIVVRDVVVVVRMRFHGESSSLINNRFKVVGVLIVYL